MTFEGNSTIDPLTKRKNKKMMGIIQKEIKRLNVKPKKEV